MAKIHSFITTLSRQGEQLIINDPIITHQAFSVLKLKVGEIIYLGDGQNIRYKTQIIDLSKNRLVTQILQDEPVTTSAVNVIIALATIKRDAFEYALEKMTEVGVNEIIPLATDKVIKKGVNQKRCQTILREASEQSMRIQVPKLHNEMSLNEALKLFIENDTVQVYFCDVSAENLEQNKIKTSPRLIKKPNTFVFFIGPEGGWSEREVMSANLLGLPNYNLGQNVLRAETAAIVAGYLATNKKL